MPNHCHFVVWRERDGDLPAFMQQVTNTHVKRWKEHRHEIGYGHLYQGRYNCFPVETEDYFYQVVRYVERNALRANLVERAKSWRWSSLRRVEREDPAFPILSTWPLPRPTDWLQIVNQPQAEPQAEAEVAALRCCVNRGRPFGDPNWVTDTAKRLGLEWTIRPREGRRNNHRLVTVTCIIWILQIWRLSPPPFSGCTIRTVGCDRRPRPEIMAHARKRPVRKEGKVHRLGAAARLLRQEHPVF